MIAVRLNGEARQVPVGTTLGVLVAELAELAEPPGEAKPGEAKQDKWDKRERKPVGVVVVDLPEEADVAPEADLPREVRGTAVVVNAEVVRRADWATTVLVEGDRVEVLRAAQGGC